ncbi:MAG: serine hydrolase [Planctomycetia bacterium]|nr:serine hydrolase [Planctomycetia bacterium]
MFSFYRVGLSTAITFLICAAVVHAEVIVVDQSMTLTPGTYSNDYVFSGNEGVLNVDTQNTANWIFVDSLSTQENSWGNMKVYGNVDATGAAMEVTGSMAGFVGTITIGTATRDSTARSPNWFVLERGTNNGSENAEIVLQTKSNHGILIRYNAAVSDGQYYFGALRGTGGFRLEGFTETPELHIGTLRTDTSAVDVFHGTFVGNSSTLVKKGNGTLLLTEKNTTGGDFQLNGMVIHAGTVQIGDYGHVYDATDLYYTAGTVGTGETPSAILTKAVPITIQEGGNLGIGKKDHLTVMNPLTVTGGTLGNANAGTTLTFRGNMEAENLVIGGQGTVTFSENNTTQTFTGTTTLRSGTLELDSFARIDNTPVLLDGGTLRYTNSPDIPSGRFFVTSQGGIFDYPNAGGTLHGLQNATGTELGLFTITRSTAATDFVNGIALGSLGSDESANFTMKGTVRIAGNAIVSLGDTVNLQNITLNLDTTTSKTSGLYLVRALKTVNGSLSDVPNIHQLGDLTGEGLVTTQKSYYSDGTPKIFKIQVGYQNNDSTFQGAMVHYSSIVKNPLSVEKVGSGTWTLGATATEDSPANVDNNITTLTVSGGTLELARRANKIAADDVVVTENTQLRIAATDQKIADSLEVQAGGNLEFCLTGKEDSGSLILGGDLFFDLEATLTWSFSENFQENWDSDLRLDLLTIGGEYGSFAEVFREAVEKNAILSQFMYPHISDDGVFSLYAKANTVPEPSTWAILLGGTLFLFLRGGRMKKKMYFPLFLGISICFAEGIYGDEPLKQVSPDELQMEETCFCQIDRWIQELIEAENIPGALVAVGRGDRLALLRRWGERQRNPHPEPLTWDTLYDLASVGKVVGLAPSIAMLVDQGKIAYTDKVSQHLPEFTGKGKENITIYDFLTHTSGIQDGYSWEGTPDDIWKRICQVSCKAKPGEQFEYSCLGFLILGKLVERVSGETYADYTRNHLFVPLGMVDTMFLLDPERRKRTATTQFFDGRWIKGEPNDTRSRRMGGGTGNGANFSTINDMAIFASVMLRQGKYVTETGECKRLFSPETFERMVASYQTPAGIRSLGWDKRSNRENRGALMSPQAIGHGGWTGTAIWVDPAFNTFVVVLSTRLNIHPANPNIYPTVAKIADCAIDSIRDPHNETRIRSSVRDSVLSPKEKETFQCLAGRKVGIITDSLAIDREEIPSVVKMLRAGIDVNVVFCRDEGTAEKIRTACQKANLSVPAFRQLSEGATRRLLPPHIQGLDTLVFDAVTSGKGNDQTVADLGRAMQTAADNGLAFLLIDRPHPTGMFQVSGTFSLPGSEPKIAFRRLPTEYAMSLGELALLFQSEYRLGLTLSVIPYQKVEIHVPGTEKEPVITQTISLKGDMPWFQYQRGLYLIYPREAF